MLYCLGPVDMSQGTIDSVRKCIAEGRQVAAKASRAERKARLLEMCGELDQLLVEIAALQAAGKVGGMSLSVCKPLDLGI